MRREGAFTSSKDGGGMKLIANLHLVPTLRIYLLMDANILIFSITPALDKGEWLVLGSGLFNLDRSASGTL